MRKRLVFAAVCILAIPLLFSPSRKSNFTDSSPFSTVALAGRTSYGGWCQCGAEGCICDPGESLNGNVAHKRSGDKPGDKPVAPEADPASGLMVLMLALLFWLRLRL